MIKLGFPVGLYLGGVKLKSCQPLMLMNGVACVCSGVGKSRDLEVPAFVTPCKTLPTHLISGSGTFS